MSGSESSESEDLELNQSKDWRGNGYWRPVDPDLWKKRSEPQELGGIVASWFKRIGGVFSSTEFLLFVAAPLGGLGAYLTFYIAYYLGGTTLFGAYFVGLWCAIIFAGVVILEKSGYSRNFENWDFPLRRVLFQPVGFGVVLGAFLLLLYLTGHLH